ncbi:hypothetical protein LTR09_012340 [Extremus antarcticus]|uniref:Clr5 domain-containing protein n=1 Tax=Extremus antarcticus TaxID=702011 RepID=A0AAJ0G746_9PEZI|nr:hypothetical protein LTR09_012340 [Extremus antarcticus]
MTLPRLVSRTSGPAVAIVPEPQRLPTPDDWAARYFEIERLYVYERRKLRFIMQYMAREHNFKATEQMYKKRFAKWGFQKNSRRPDKDASVSAANDACRRLAKRERNSVEEPKSIPATLELGHDEALIRGFVASVQKWSVAFFERGSPDGGDFPCTQQRAPLDQTWSEKAKETSFTFKLVSDLLERGHGGLAGRMVRKAFLLVEDILSLEGPVLVWTLLEIMHHMLTLGHEQLFQILLAHLIGLVHGRMSRTHPLSVMLHTLQGLVASLTNGPLCSGSCPLAPSSSARTGGNSTKTSSQPLLFSPLVSPLLEEAWILNAEIVFGHFDPEFSQLYFQLYWESCSINLPSGIIGTVKQWLRHLGPRQTYPGYRDAGRAEGVVRNDLVDHDRMLQSLLAPRLDASPPQDYEMLRASSVAAVCGIGNPILSGGPVFNGDTTAALRILPALLKARILEQPSAVAQRTNKKSDGTVKVSRSEAANMACVVRALTDLNVHHGTLLGLMERIRSLVALREYAYSETDPQVMREMWLLRDTLSLAGEQGKAQIVEQSVIRRLEKYTYDVPLDSVWSSSLFFLGTITARRTVPFC